MDSPIPRDELSVLAAFAVGLRTSAVDGGFLYVGGADASRGFGSWTWQAEKRSVVDGVLDPSFGSAGVVASDPGPGTDQTLHAMVVSPFAVYLSGGPGLRMEKRAK